MKIFRFSKILFFSDIFDLHSAQELENSGTYIEFIFSFSNGKVAKFSECNLMSELLECKVEVKERDHAVNA
jgi:hypothetical protein